MSAPILPTVHGPMVIPFRALGGGDGWSHHPGLYGRYLPIDLDENNRHGRERFAERHGREPAPFGWGVCRHGFGLQHHQGVMTREQAEAWARELNAAAPIGGER